jgi:thiamine phosphate synthase YjbQ (UPF0047 family)
MRCSCSAAAATSTLAGLAVVMVAAIIPAVADAAPSFITGPRNGRLSSSAFVIVPSGASAFASASSSLSATAADAALGSPICDYRQVTIPTSQTGPPRQRISVEDLTPTLNDLLSDSGMKNGVIIVISRHTTTAITINERESRLARDMEKYLLNLAPPDERSSAEAAQAGVRYFHNDIDQRPDSPEEAQRCRDNGWEIDDEKQLEAWRAQEPINAHSHLLSMLLGSSESIPVVEGRMVIGQWQSVLMVDLDGPRERTVGVQFMGYR